MKKNLITLSAILVFGLSGAACGWKPSVAAVPITPPWSTMNLPVKENAVVWKSDPTEFRAVHKEDKKTVMGKYVEVLKGSGWTLSKFETGESEYTAEMQKGSDTYELRAYDFENTGVVIEKKK